RFDIPAGPLDAALAAFEKTTGLKVVAAPGIALGGFTSTGVAGVHTPEQALERIVAGTALQFRAVAGGGYSIDVAITERVEVTARLIPYRVEESAAATKTL